MTLTEFLTDIADAIRGKTGSTDKISASDFATAIASLETGSEPTFKYYKNTVNVAAGTGTKTISTSFSGLSSLDFVVMFGGGSYGQGASFLFAMYPETNMTINGTAVTYSTTWNLSSASSAYVYGFGKAK